MSSLPAQLIFVDRNKAVIDALRAEFEDVAEANFHVGDFAEVDFDAIVSPANSFGLMDGGFDGALTRRYGLQLPYRVQTIIGRRYAGCQPLGTAFILPLTEERRTDHSTAPFAGPWLVHAPTMVTPRDIRGTTNVYDAFKAILLAFPYEGGHGWANSQRRLATSGLGTLTGRMTPESAAKQMRVAWNHVAQSPIQPSNMSWQWATGRNDVLTALAVECEAPAPAEPLDSPQTNAGRLVGFLA